MPPSESRLASQTHIEREKDKQTITECKDTETEIQITATFSPDEDGTAFTRIDTSKPRLRTEITPTISKTLPKSKEQGEHPLQPAAALPVNIPSETPERETTNQHERMNTYPSQQQPG